MLRTVRRSEPFFKWINIFLPSLSYSTGRHELAVNASNETGIVAFNTSTKSKSPILTKYPRLLSWYICGPTVYDHSHIGHAWCYVNFDILRRVMERYFDLSVVQVMNITDVDDKIINKAQESNVPVKEIAEKYKIDFLQDMSQLGVKPPSIMTQVTDFIPQIISFIDKIIKEDLAYTTSDGSVYFDLSSYSEKYPYGKLKPVLVNMITEPESLKKSPHDFALWKGQKFESEISWDAPWGGRGRPGWHIECSAMASSIFGSWLDLHSGGIDLAFPHHENEEAQCCAYHRVHQWVGHWIHTKHLHLSGNVKMSKSLKNTISIKDFLESHTADQFRMMCLLSHYRTEMEYSETALNMAKEVLNSVRNFLDDCRVFIGNQQAGLDVNVVELQEALIGTKKKIRAHLADDFSTAQATNSVRELMSFVQQEIKQSNVKSNTNSGVEAVVAVANFVSDYFESVGLNVAPLDDGKTSDVHWKAIVDDLVSFRSQVRRFALAMDDPSLTKEEKRQLMTERRILIKACDTLRDQLMLKGIQLKDRQALTTWTYRRP